MQHQCTNAQHEFIDNKISDKLKITVLQSSTEDVVNIRIHLLDNLRVQGAGGVFMKNSSSVTFTVSVRDQSVAFDPWNVNAYEYIQFAL